MILLSEDLMAVVSAVIWSLEQNSTRFWKGSRTFLEMLLRKNLWLTVNILMQCSRIEIKWKECMKAIVLKYPSKEIYVGGIYDEEQLIDLSSVKGISWELIFFSHLRFLSKQVKFLHFRATFRTPLQLSGFYCFLVW